MHALIGRARRLRLGWDQEVPSATGAHLIRVPCPGAVCGLVPPVSWDELAACSGQDQRCKSPEVPVRYPSKPESKVTSVFGCRRGQIGAKQPNVSVVCPGLERSQVEAGGKSCSRKQRQRLQQRLRLRLVQRGLQGWTIEMCGRYASPSFHKCTATVQLCMWQREILLVGRAGV